MAAPNSITDPVTWGTPRARWVLLATVLGSGMAFLDATVVNVALPTIGSELNASVAGLQWVINGYTLTLASLILLGGSLGDRFGRRKMFLLGVVWFAGASLLCGIAPTSETLVASRALQGMGGALLTPGSLAILQASFATSDRGRAVGAWSGLSGVAAAIAPFLGGWLIGVGSWRLIFLINMPLAVAVIAVALRHVPETRDLSAERGIDVIGAVLTIVGLAGVTWALIAAGERGATTAVLSTGAVGLASLAGFVAAERRVRHPMLPLEIFRSRQFTAANLVTLIVYASLSVMFFLLVVHLQQVLGYSPLLAGAATLPVTALMLVLSAPAGMLADRIGPRLPMTVGPLAIAAGLAPLSRVQAESTYVGSILPGLLVFGLGSAAHRHSACSHGHRACRHCVRGEQCDLPGSRPPRRRGDSGSHGSDRRCLSRPCYLRERLSRSDAHQCRSGGGWRIARVALYPERNRWPSGLAAGGQPGLAPLLCSRRHTSGDRARHPKIHATFR
jgi:EmrB/QacA subfamily drug resistance transporter